jgi:hypothetical protein
MIAVVPGKADFFSYLDYLLEWSATFFAHF